MIHVTVSPRSERPIYQQLYDQISAQIIRGDLKPDDALPPIRTLAKELRVSVITVKKAWELLDRDGLLYGVVGRGSFVADLSSGERSTKRISTVVDRLRDGVEHCKATGLSLEEILDSVREIYEQSGE